MPNFVELWVYLSATPLFGLTATLVVYLVAQQAYARCGRAPIANPVLWSVIFLAAGLHLTNVPYPTYFAGAQFIHFLLGPAVVALAWPMWLHRAAIRKRWASLLVASFAGGAAASLSAVALGMAAGLPVEVLLSLVPKSVTAPVAMGLASTLGGVPALAAAFAITTGLVGAVSGKYLFSMIGISSNGPGMAARGFALGTASHGIGAARAVQVDSIAGAYAGVALGLQVLLASLLMPILAKLFL